MSDLRDALRALRATPVVTAVAVLSLALGIGANTAIFSILNAVMLRALPVREPQRLVQVLSGPQRTSWSNPLWEQLRDRDRQLFDGAFAYSSPRFNLNSGGEATFANGLIASGEFFDVLGVRAILGRTFTPAEDGPHVKDGPVAVVSYAFWQRHYAGAADVIGRSITLDRIPFTIIGVTAPEFTGVDQGVSYDVAVPLASEPLLRGEKESALKQPRWWWLRVLARLKPGDSIEGAAAALRGLQPQMRAATMPPDMRPQDVPNYLKDPFGLRPAANGPASFGRQYRQPLFVIMGVVGLVLLIACANIANLLLARASARRHEVSVRIALGASRWRIARQLLVESAVLAGAGTIAALLVARWAATLLVYELSGEQTARALDVGLDWRVLLFTVTVASATALLFGMFPALRASRVAPGEAIKEHGRSILGGDGRRGFGAVLVVGQVALSLVLVVAAALFMRTFSSLTHVRLGFDPNPLLLADLNVRRSAVPPTERAALYERIRDAVSVVPGVQSASVQSVTPLTNSEWDTLIQNPPGLSLAENQRDVHVNSVSRGFFATYGTPILAGRDFTVQDALAAPRVVLVNETFARKYFPGVNPIGRTVREEPFGSDVPPPKQVIGVVRDAVYESLRQAIPPTMYEHEMQQEKPRPSITVAVRAAHGSPDLLSRGVADAIVRVDKDVTISFHPYRTTIREATAQERVVAMLSAFFGGLALLLAGVGLYGVMTYAVARRRTEIGIRMALGAEPAGILRVVLARVAWLVAAGIAAGAILALWASQFVASLLFGLQPRDPLTLGIAIAVLVAIGAVAGVVPAWRASHVDPSTMLREG